MSNVLSNLENQVLTITINRPDKLNALNQATLRELDGIIEQAQNDDDTKVIIITGAAVRGRVLHFYTIPACPAARNASLFARN